MGTTDDCIWEHFQQISAVTGTFGATCRSRRVICEHSSKILFEIYSSCTKDFSVLTSETSLRNGGGGLFSITVSGICLPY